MKTTITIKMDDIQEREKLSTKFENARRHFEHWLFKAYYAR